MTIGTGFVKRPTDARPDHVQDHLARGLRADQPNTNWFTDITDIRTAEGWLYLFVVVDFYSALVVGWSMSSRQNRWVAQKVSEQKGRWLEWDTRRVALKIQAAKTR
jgi:transposase InsO family protein